MIDKTDDCDHGVVFNETEADMLAYAATEKEHIVPNADILEFLAGPPEAYEIRRRWPRLNGPCPKGCGFNGIAYASYMHYIMGDW